MQGQTAQVLKVSDEFAVNNDIQKLSSATRTAKLALIKARNMELLDKEAVCCNVATD